MAAVSSLNFDTERSSPHRCVIPLSFYFSSDDDDDITYTPQKSQRRGTPPHLRKLESPRKSENPRPKVKRPRSRSPHPSTPEQPWKTHTDPDVGPKLPRFVPARPPGVQLDKSKVYSPLDLFQLFFNNNVVRQLCSNTNKQARKRLAQGLQFKWVDVTPPRVPKVYLTRYFHGTLKAGISKSLLETKKHFLSAISEDGDAKGQVALHFLKHTHERSGRGQRE